MCWKNGCFCQWRRVGYELDKDDESNLKIRQIKVVFRYAQQMFHQDSENEISSKLNAH